MEKYYSVAVRKKKNPDDCFFFNKEFIFHEVKIDTKGKYWIADPFLFEHEGVTYLFYEALDLYLNKGVIAYSILNDDYTATAPKVIINEKFHLSFPYIFERDGQVYIMPESCGKDDVHIYKSINFPDIWKEDRVLINNVFVTDSILLNDNEEVYLLSSEQYRYCPSDKVVSCWVKNRLFSNIFNDRDVSGSVVSAGDLGIRNAGGVFKVGNNLYRPGQNSPNGKYGKGLRFFQIDSIQPYVEHDCYKIDCEEMQDHIKFIGEKRIVGTHTYNSTNKYEVIDLSYFSENKFPIDLYRNLRRVLRFGKRNLISSIKFFKKVTSGLDRRLNSKKYQSYFAEIDVSAPWVFVSYIADPFYSRSDENYLNLHQNKREALKMAEVFNTLGYNVYFCLHNSDVELPDLDVRLVFGHEPNFARACEKYPNAKKIYYGVSTHYDYRNRKIKQMTDDFNSTFAGKVPYRRLVEPHKSQIIADSILLIGSQETIKTYPEQLRDKITLIHQSTQKCRSLKYLDVADGKEFIFIGSGGNALKGVGPLVEYFIHHPDLELHWVGPIEDEVNEALKGKITPNIHTYGFQNIGSDLVLGLFERCNFMIYPSGVEGVPGSVLNAMKSGMIPLVTPWASFDGADKIGYVMKDATVEEIDKAVVWALSLEKDQIIDKKKRCKSFVDKNYNLDVFKREFEDYMIEQIGRIE